jgi:hypothetical protein
MCQECAKEADRVINRLIIAASLIVFVLTIAVVMVVNQWMR